MSEEKIPVPDNFKKENQPANYGYDPSQEEEDEQPEDFQFGSGKFVKEKFDNLLAYRPQGESQKGQYIDSYMCVLFSLCKCIAYRMNWRMKHKMGIEERAWLESNKLIKDGEFNASDLFLGILAGVRWGRGTSMKKGIGTAKKVGLIAEQLFPFKYYARSWKELTEQPTEKQLKVALAWLDRYKLWYENVGQDTTKMKSALDFGVLWVAGFAWPGKTNGMYIRTDARANHCFVVDKYTEVNGPNNDFWDAPDSYPTNDNNFVKKLMWNYKFWFVKQIDCTYLLEEEDNKEKKKLLENRNIKIYMAPSDGIITPDGTKFKKNDRLSFWEMFKAIFYKLKGIFEK